jgi:hypothetical protein
MILNYNLYIKLDREREKERGAKGNELPPRNIKPEKA